MIFWLRAGNGEPNCPASIAADSSACGVGIENEDDVVPREAFAAIVDLDAAAHEIERQRETILAGAKARAEALVAQAEADAAHLRDEARREYETAAQGGYDAGREQGLTEWYERSARSAAGQRRVQSLLRERIVELVVDATEQIVRNVDISALFARSAEVVERLVEGSTYLRVRVHPADEPAAAGEFERLAAVWRERGHGVAVTVLADRAVARGACLCESDLGTVDASLDTQLAALRAAVTRAVRRTSGSPGSEPDAADAESDADADTDALARPGVHAGQDVGFDDEGDDQTDDQTAAGCEASAGSGFVRLHAAAETYAEDGGNDEDCLAMPWLGDPDYDRVAHPDYPAAGHHS